MTNMLSNETIDVVIRMTEIAEELSKVFGISVTAAMRIQLVFLQGLTKKGESTSVDTLEEVLKKFKPGSIQ